MCKASSVIYGLSCDRFRNPYWEHNIAPSPGGCIFLSLAVPPQHCIVVFSLGFPTLSPGLDKIKKSPRPVLSPNDHIWSRKFAGILCSHLESVGHPHSCLLYFWVRSQTLVHVASLCPPMALGLKWEKSRQGELIAELSSKTSSTSHFQPNPLQLWYEKGLETSLEILQILLHDLTIHSATPHLSSYALSLNFHL